jgi:hypothetical protein
MAQPGACLAMELRRLLPDLRRASATSGGTGRVRPRRLVTRPVRAHACGRFRRADLAQDPPENVDPDLLTDLTYTDQAGRTHAWLVADTTVDLPAGDEGEVFTMRQVTLIVANNRAGRETRGQDSTRQIHILTTRTDLSAEQVIFPMGSRWRQEKTTSGTPGCTSTWTPTTRRPPPRMTRRQSCVKRRSGVKTRSKAAAWVLD